MVGARIDGTQPELLGRWMGLEALTTRNTYEASNIYNMDQIGYSIGPKQSTQVMICLDRPKSDSEPFQPRQTQAIRKLKGGRQECVTAIECVSMSDSAL